jgi:hypothetical protein
MCQGPVLQRWQAACLTDLLSVDGVELALAIQPAENEPSGLRATVRGHPLGRRALHPANLPFTLYHSLVFRPRSAEPVDMREQFADVPVMECTVRRKGRWSQYFAAEDVSAIRAQELDFILRFAFGIIRGEILNAARYGVWSYHHGDEERYRGMPSCFWEIHNGDPVTGAVLQRLTDRLDGGVVLRKGFFKTNFGSLADTRDRVLFGSAGWPAQLCRALQRGEEKLFQAEPSPTTAPIYTWPRGRQGGRVLVAMACIKARGQVEPALRTPGWNVGIAAQPAPDLLRGGPPRGVTWLPQRRGRFAADPFALRRGGSLHILYEEYIERLERGQIVHRTLAEDGTLTQPEPVLPLDVHASYPYLVEHEGETYLIPETQEAQQVVLYRAHDFPSDWRPEATLLQGAGYTDASVVHHDGRWWLFCTLRETDPNLNLHIWHSADLRGPWLAHADNPVKTDVRSARPAGAPFVHEGALYRPAQDCSKTYGGSIVINRVQTLTPVSFAEEPVATVRPDGTGGYPDGIHTISPAGPHTVLDGNRRGFSAHAFLGILRRRLGGAARAKDLGGS